MMRVLTTACVWLAIALMLPATAAGSALTEWNRTLLEVAKAEDSFLTLKGVRATAMMHLAINDTLVAIDGGTTAYAYEKRASGVDAQAAALSAAHAIAVDQYPDARERFDALLERWMPDGLSKDARAKASSLGVAAARAVLETRADDGWSGEAEYSFHPMGPGVYAEFNEHSGTPEGFVFGAGWADARGFALREPGQFRSPPPPAISSGAYTEAFDEVKELGRFQSMTRTHDQTHLALWWKDFVENSHNRLARALVEKEGLSLARANRLFALLNMSVLDAYVASFDNKFHYNHWRPYTAIRWAEHDENAATEPEGTWNNTHRHTYAFPSYPSAHGTACAAAMTAFTDTFGENYAFTMRTETVDIAGPFSEPLVMQPATRSFDSFAEAANECAMSRVYLGIHFRYDSVEGYRLGTRVGENVIDTWLKPAP